MSPRLGRALGWTAAVGGVAAAHVLTLDHPPVVRMLAISGVLFLAMKAVVLAEWSDRGVRLPSLRLLAFVTLWPGMRPGVCALRATRRTSAPLIHAGLGRIAIGLALLLGARTLYACTGSEALATVLLLPALSIAVHFGLFDLLAGLWCRAGAATSSLFRAPWRSRSLAEFWSVRWNLAFSEMTAVAIHRPLAKRFGADVALLASFAASGLAHEAAISLPVRAGYGLPLAYFLLHGALVLWERRGGPSGRAWTIATLVLPLPILFHPPFLRAVAWPLLQ